MYLPEGKALTDMNNPSRQYYRSKYIKSTLTFEKVHDMGLGRSRMD